MEYSGRYISFNKKFKNKKYVLDEELICNVIKIGIIDLIKIDSLIEKTILLHMEKQDMVYHNKIYYSNHMYLVLYAVKDRNNDDKDLIFPIQFAIAEYYCRRFKKNKCIYCVYKIKNKIYIILTYKKTIILSRIINVINKISISDFIDEDIKYGLRYGAANPIMITNMNEIKEQNDLFSTVEEMKINV